MDRELVDEEVVKAAPECSRVHASLPFTGRWLLAPMEGVTEPCFRELVLARNAPDQLGGAFTEFARVVDHPLPAKMLRAHLGPHRFAAPVGLQMMGNDLAALAATAVRAKDVGVPLIDLNFGCPAKGALRTCAGSALLREPRRIEEIVRVCADAVPELPVTAKIRAGYDDAELVTELARAAEAGGAQLLTIHCRTRAEGYQAEVDWTRIARAVAAVEIPVCGNGGIERHADLERMRHETGCAFAMVGRAALGDPWIFSGHPATRVEAAEFLLEYAKALVERKAFSERGVAGRLKQLLQHWTAGDLLGGERRAWMREPGGSELLRRLRAVRQEPASRE